MTPEPCHCFVPPLNYRDYDVREVGTDTAGGRYAEVTIETCVACGAVWLRYFYEMEAFSESGRWYRAVVTPEQAAAVTAGRALRLIAEQAWHLRGGSYFRSAGTRSTAALTELDER